MRVHHLRHHAASTDKLNTALAELRAMPQHKALVKQGVDTLLQQLDQLPGRDCVSQTARIDADGSPPTESHRAVVRNNGGGYVNHALFWCDPNALITRAACNPPPAHARVGSSCHPRVVGSRAGSWQRPSSPALALSRPSKRILLALPST